MQLFLEHTINGLAVGSIYALIALGLAMVYGITPGEAAALRALEILDGPGGEEDFSSPQGHYEAL